MKVDAGTIIDDRYVVLEQLGEGGMGSVYKAREVGLERIVAIKLLHPSLIGSQESRVRFSREGKILSSISHPQILQLYRFGFWNETLPFIAMEYIVGKTLRQITTETGGLNPDRCIAIGIQVCNAMNVAHTNNIVHRDLSPANIMLIDEHVCETVKIVDFGLSRMLPHLAETHEQLTQTGALVGSIYYMSPEQCSGKKADHRSDIYALGCVLFEALTSNPPFDADNPIALMHKHVTEPPQRLEEALPDKALPSGLSAIISKTLAKEPAERYQSMSEFKADLELVRDGRGSDIANFDNQQAKRRLPTPALLVVSTVIFSSVIGFAISKYQTKDSFYDDPSIKHSLSGNTAAHMAHTFARQETASSQKRIDYYTTWIKTYGSPDSLDAARARMELGLELSQRNAKDLRATSLLKEALRRFIIIENENLPDSEVNYSDSRADNLRESVLGMSLCATDHERSNIVRNELANLASTLSKIQPGERRVLFACYRNLGILAMRQNQWSQALPWWQRALAYAGTEQQKAEISLNESICLRSSGQNEQALKVLAGLCKEATTRADERFLPPWVTGLCNELARLGKYQEALRIAKIFDSYSPSIDIDLESRRILNANMLEGSGKALEACDLLARAIRERKSDNTRMLLRMAQISAKNKFLKRDDVMMLLTNRMKQPVSSRDQRDDLEKALANMESKIDLTDSTNLPAAATYGERDIQYVGE